VRESDLGIASATSRLMSQVGAAFGITLLTIVYGGVNTGAAFATAFAVGAGLSALSVAAAVAMGTRAQRSWQAATPLSEVPGAELVAKP
jgi:hypothetical protein